MMAWVDYKLFSTEGNGMASSDEIIRIDVDMDRVDEAFYLSRRIAEETGHDPSRIKAVSASE
ncbi:hypothetical protein [Alkalicoccus chagannorensis]|uniref:hypothetical protein n=1 Tax=Alkalicoccus chagannorensis TaxID=427072 RepID=UPI000479C460|nr:hypothetical protein [Alkalicoccus chagannorensis]